MMEKPKHKIVQLPEKGKIKYLEPICNGNNRVAGLLDYFIFGANLEADHQKLEENCKVVTFTRRHKDILEKLNFNISRKTLIHYIDLLDEWGYVSSQAYGKTFTVNGDKIEEAIKNPPQKPPRKLRTTKSCKVENESEQKVVDLSQENNSTTLQLLKIIEKLEQKVVDLEQKVESLQPSNVVDLQLKVVDLQQKVVILQQKVEGSSTLQPCFQPLAESDEGHNFDPYSNNSNNKNITVIYIPNESEHQTIVADATIPSVSSSENLEQESSHIVSQATNGNVEQSTTHSLETTEQPPLFNAPTTPEMPNETAKWCAEALVQIVEFKRGKRFLEEARGKSQKSQRQRQLDAAKKIIDTKITREEFIRAYDTRNDPWWQENRGDLTVVDMAAKTTKNVMRTLEVLENIDSKKGAKSNQPISSCHNGMLTQEEKPRPSVLVSEAQKQKNIEKLRAAVAAKGIKI